MIRTSFLIRGWTWIGGVLLLWGWFFGNPMFSVPPLLCDWLKILGGSSLTLLFLGFFISSNRYPYGLEKKEASQCRDTLIFVTACWFALFSLYSILFSMWGS